MKYMGYWAVTLTAGCRLAGGRRQTLAQSVAFYQALGAAALHQVDLPF